MTTKNYPTDFPDGVPPDDADVAHGCAYRLVTNNPPHPNDFCGYYKEPFPKNIPKNPKPNFFGTSMYRNYNEIELARGMYKNLREKQIAYGELHSTHGVISKERHDSHFDAWLKENSGIEIEFRIVGNE